MVSIYIVILRILTISFITSLNSKAWTTKTSTLSRSNRQGLSSSSSAIASASASAIGSSTVMTDTSSPPSWFSTSVDNNSNDTNDDSSTANSPSVEQLKIQILQLGAALDRGQAYNPTSGSYYEENMNVARHKIEQLLDKMIVMDEAEQQQQDIDNSSSNSSSRSKTVPNSLEEIEGEWELVLSTVPHGIFRSSPFFLAIEEAYEYAETKIFEDGTSKPGLFFKLHELQTCSWGASKVGRIAQFIDPKSKYLYSTFDTSLFSLTVIPILGWFKLLPTFGGCVVTAATIQDLQQDVFHNRKVARLDMVVDYTTSRKVEGLDGLPLFGDIIWKINVPVGAIWKLLPWNKGREATCKVYINYVDQDFRIVQEISGEYFVYTRPVVPRELLIA
mmetsp:Transcript_30858/g.34530  ORF Transcript_30858/g.34530 Transcript_30858/m.34530 type:complete len:389 (-) Transcript_30858:112-1278(-)